MRPERSADGLPISNWDDDDLSLFTKEMWAHFHWRFLNGQNPDDGLPLFDGTGAGRGKLSREDIDNRIGAAGMWWDPHLGIYHVRHRAYDPRLGRFLQPDPIGVAGGWNVFEYVGGDPANGIDPLGLYTLYDWWMDIGAGAGVIGDGVSYVTNSAYRMVAGNGSPQLSEGFEAGIRLREDIARDLNGSAGDAARTHAEDMRNFQREMGTASDLAFNVVLYNIAPGLNVRTDAVGLAALQKGYRVVREGDRDIAIATNGQRFAVIAADTTGTVKAAKGAEGATDAAKAAAACGNAAKAGKTVIGKYPKYLEVAQELKANALNIDPEVWKLMEGNDALQWAANRKFLDEVIERGDEIILASPPGDARPGTFFARELEYLMERGFVPSPDGTKMIRKATP